MISPLLFTIMIIDVFSRIRPDVGKSLYADDGALWKRGRNVQHIVRKVQEGINKVKQWGYEWGFKCSIEKMQKVFSTRKNIEENVKLNMYDRSLERVRVFRFLGVHFYSRIT